jgi:hypothetical protein
MPPPVSRRHLLALAAAAGPRLIVKDETRYAPKKHLQMAVAAGDTRAPFPALGPPFTPAGLWVEGRDGADGLS